MQDSDTSTQNDTPRQSDSTVFSFWPMVLLWTIVIVSGFMYIRSLVHSPGTAEEKTSPLSEQMRAGDLHEKQTAETSVGAAKGSVASRVKGDVEVGTSRAAAASSGVAKGIDERVDAPTADRTGTVPTDIEIDSAESPEKSHDVTSEGQEGKYSATQVSKGDTSVKSISVVGSSYPRDKEMLIHKPKTTEVVERILDPTQGTSSKTKFKQKKLTAAAPELEGSAEKGKMVNDKRQETIALQPGLPSQAEGAAGLPKNRDKPGDSRPDRVSARESTTASEKPTPDKDAKVPGEKPQGYSAVAAERQMHEFQKSQGARFRAEMAAMHRKYQAEMQKLRARQIERFESMRNRPAMLLPPGYPDTYNNYPGP